VRKTIFSQLEDLNSLERNLLDVVLEKFSFSPFPQSASSLSACKDITHVSIISILIELVFLEIIWYLCIFVV
jgi:hypothetical protein